MLIICELSLRVISFAIVTYYYVAVGFEHTKDITSRTILQDFLRIFKKILKTFFLVTDNTKCILRMTVGFLNQFLSFKNHAIYFRTQLFLHKIREKYVYKSIPGMSANNKT